MSARAEEAFGRVGAPDAAAGIGDRSTLEAAGSPLAAPLASRLTEVLRNVLIGSVAGAVAVLLRYATGLPSSILSSFLAVIAICLVTVRAGLVGGIATMIVGGIGTSYLIMSPPGSWSVTGADIYSLLGFFTVGCVILITSQLYRRSEQKRQSVMLALARQEAEQQRFFAGEMSHRLKNALAIVQALASQTFDRNAPELPKFEARLKALAGAHNLLMEHVATPRASVTNLVHTATGAFADGSGRIRTDGPDIELPANQVVALALALHELGTNAVKHGALRDQNGWVSISWRQADGGFQLEWKEHDGPPVEAPARKGFGTRLLTRSTMRSDLRFELDGLRCTIDLR